jgi:rare lipoprotein A
MRRHIARWLAVLVIAGLGVAQGPASSGLPKTTAELKRVAPATTAQPKPRPYQVGTASWYGEDFDGKPTASGEPYNMYDLTAAHPTLPLGTMVKVTNLHNRNAVVVRINDRGPIVPGRIIDLSYSAAKVLKFQQRGIQRVRLDVVPRRKAPATLAMLNKPSFGE